METADRALSNQLQMPTCRQTRGPDTEAGQAADKTRPEGGAHSEGTAPPNGRDRAVVGGRDWGPKMSTIKCPV